MSREALLVEALQLAEVVGPLAFGLVDLAWSAGIRPNIFFEVRWRGGGPPRDISAEEVLTEAFDELLPLRRGLGNAAAKMQLRPKTDTPYSDLLREAVSIGPHPRRRQSINKRNPLISTSVLPRLGLSTAAEAMK